MSKAAHTFILRGVRALYIPCMDEEAQSLLAEYEKSGDPDIADHLIGCRKTRKMGRRIHIIDGLYIFKQKKLVTATSTRCRSASSTRPGYSSGPGY